MRARILITEPKDFSARALALLREHADVDARETPAEGLRSAFGEYDVVWLRLAHKIHAALLEAPLRCRVLATPVTGLDHLDLGACARARIKVVSLKGEVEFLKQVRATAELTVGLALALMRRVGPAAESVRRGEWRRDLFRGNELFGKTVGIVGVGRLGELVATTFGVFGMTVLGFDIRPDFPSSITRVASLEELLARSELVTLHVSLDPTTRGMFGAAQFASMRRGSWLVNTSRGGVVDEAALVAALESGHLAGAALDVLSGEPAVDGTHPMIRYAQAHDNLLVVPHIGGNTFESFEKTEVFLAMRVLEALR